MQNFNVHVYKTQWNKNTDHNFCTFVTINQ